MGSIGDNSIGGWYAYRASKTALNQLTKTMSVEFGRRKQMVSCILLHPGTVATDLSAPFQKVRSPLHWWVHCVMGIFLQFLVKADIYLFRNP